MRCPACTSPRTWQGPASRGTGRVVAGCRACGAHFIPEEAPAPTEVVASEEIDGEYVSNWVSYKRDGVGPEAWQDSLVWLRDAVETHGRTPQLYDIGACAGEFLAVARDEFGFEVFGNEVLESSLPIAKEMSGIDLELGDLSALGHENEFDAATLWCVLAHVTDGEQLMRDVFRLLRPGGVVFLQTPHRTIADRASHGLKRLSAGRLSQVPDRRLAGHHRILHTRASITALLERIGFTEVEVEPQVRYSMASQAYLVSIHTPGWAIRPASWVMDKAVAGGAVPRITLDVRARKPR
jgi:SAM-dependent methyltransferase